MLPPTGVCVCENLTPQSYRGGQHQHQSNFCPWLTSYRCTTYSTKMWNIMCNYHTLVSKRNIHLVHWSHVMVYYICRCIKTTEALCSSARGRFHAALHTHLHWLMTGIPASCVWKISAGCADWKKGTLPSLSSRVGPTFTVEEQGMPPHQFLIIEECKALWGEPLLIVSC